MKFIIGKIIIDIPTDNSRLGIAVIKGKFYKIYKEIKRFEKQYREKIKEV